MPATPRALALARRRLLDWYDRHRRRLPWREARPDPYRVLVSEMMLQQTRVAAVIPYYRRFLERFPDVGSLAAAPVEEVLAAWSGLGYYRRARHLHAAARSIVERHGGSFPREAAAVRELPGVGRYTAGAVRSIAFGDPEPVVDGNVARVLARLRGIRGDPRSGAVSRRLWEAAARLVDPARPGDFNQALMELGATLCLPARPDCGRCPWEPACVARATGRPESLPTREPRRPVRPEHAAALVLRRGGRLFLVQRAGEGLLEGMWELPGDGGGGAGEPRRLTEALRSRYALHAEVGDHLGHVRHGILDRSIRLELYRGRLLRPPRETVRGPWRWARPAAALAGEMALAAAARKAIRLLAAGAP